MLSSIRRALTPNTNHAEDNDPSAVTPNTSPPAPNLHVHNSSPPPFSPLEVSPEDVPPWTNQPLKGNNPVAVDQQLLPMDISPARRSPDREPEGTGHSLLGLMRDNDATSKSYERSFTLDGASDDHLYPTLKGAHASASSLPSVEPTQTTANSHRTQRTPTPGKNHPGESSTFSSPQKKVQHSAALKRLPDHRPRLLIFDTHICSLRRRCNLQVRLSRPSNSQMKTGSTQVWSQNRANSRSLPQWRPKRSVKQL